MGNADKPGAKVIDLTGVLQQKAKQEPRQVPADPSDPIVKVALELLNLVGEYTDRHPISVLAALTLTSQVLGTRYRERYGQEEFSKMVISATALARSYTPIYKEPDESA